MQSQIMYYATKKIETEHYHLQQVFRKKKERKNVSLHFSVIFKLVVLKNSTKEWQNSTLTTGKSFHSAIAVYATTYLFIFSTNMQS